MEKKLATKWVKALRSGKYKQAQGTLAKFKDEVDGDDVDLSQEKPVGFCCLGVLCDVAKVNKGQFYGLETLEIELQDALGFGSSEGEVRNENGDIVPLPFPVKRDGKTEVKNFDHLAMANDSGVSFKRIATWIEKNYKLL